MKIVVLGDTHGRTERVKKQILLLKPDYMIFTGDYYQDGLNISRDLKIEFSGVRGNCDSQNAGPQELVLEFFDKKFYIIHGHQFGVKRSLNRLFYAAQEINADIVVFGHTHVSHCNKEGNLWMLNPGSPVNPRIPDRPSYALVEVTDTSLIPSIIKM